MLVKFELMDVSDAKLLTPTPHRCDQGTNRSVKLLRNLLEIQELFARPPSVTLNLFLLKTTPSQLAAPDYSSDHPIRAESLSPPASPYTSFQQSPDGPGTTPPSSDKGHQLQEEPRQL